MPQLSILELDNQVIDDGCNWRSSPGRKKKNVLAKIGGVCHITILLLIGDSIFNHFILVREVRRNYSIIYTVSYCQYINSLNMRNKETATQRKRRLERACLMYQEKKYNDGPEAKRARLDKNRQAQTNLRATETPSMKNTRILQQRENRIQQRYAEIPTRKEDRKTAGP